MKKILLAFFIITTFRSVAQSITIVPNQDSTNFFGWPINYNGNLYIFHNYKLAFCNGNVVREISSSKAYTGYPIIYNNKLYLNMAGYLGVFDGSTISIIPNASAAGLYIGTPIVYNNKLYLDYYVPSDSSTVKLYAFDGNSFTLIPIPSDRGVDNQAPPIVYHNKLCLVFYRDSSNIATHRQLGIYNDTTLQLIPNPNSGTCIGKFTVYQDKLYFYCGSQGKGHLGVYDDKNLFQIVPNPDITGQVTYNLEDETDKPVVYNNHLYVKYQVLNNHQNVLGEYSDLNFKLFYPPNGAQLDYASPISSMVFKNKLYFNCINTPQSNNLANFDGTLINIINNPKHAIYNNAKVIYNDELYLGYTAYDSGAAHTYTYNGTKLKAVSDPNSGLGFAYSPFVINDTLFFGYLVNYFNYIDLAYITNGVLAINTLKLTTNKDLNNVILNWQTHLETNTSNFNIQRSTDGVHFTTINVVTAVGNSTYIKEYTYTDIDAAALYANKLYYRLQQVDKDDKNSFSNVQIVDFLKSNTWFTISPNPAKDYLNIITPYNIANVQITIASENGKWLYASGHNFINGEPFNIPIFKFASQTLFITVATKNSKQLFKVVKE